MLIGAYHLAYCTAVIYFLSKSQGKFTLSFAYLLGLVNIVLYLTHYGLLPFTELKEHLSNADIVLTGFGFHYLLLGLVIYTGVLISNILKRGIVDILYNKNIVLWLACGAITYIASAELLLHGLLLMTHPVTGLPVEDAPVQAYLMYESATRHILKVGFPVLWGLVAAVFLTIGIKRQIKNLRVASLVLLAVTLIKLFSYDIQDVSKAGKIIAFIILGIVLLVMSFMYQKIKATILYNETGANEKKENNENN